MIHIVKIGKDWNMGIGIVNDEFHCQPEKQPFFNQLSIPAHKKTVLKYLSTPTHFSYQINPFIAIDLGYISPSIIVRSYTNIHKMHFETHLLRVH